VKLIVLLLNTLAVLAAAVFVGLGVLYGRSGTWGVSDGLVGLVLLVPCFASIVAARNGASNVSKSVATYCAAGWAALLTLLGIGASTGIGGAAGLLIVIVPALMLLALNWCALRAKRGEQ
jgi:hypothetical protein